jgi:hypothetical protein
LRLPDALILSRSDHSLQKSLVKEGAFPSTKSLRLILAMTE